MSKDKNLRNRNSTAEFLIFSKQAGENSIEVRVEDETVWLTQKLIGVLFDADVRTVNEHLGNIYQNGELRRIKPCPHLAYLHKGINEGQVSTAYILRDCIE